MVIISMDADRIAKVVKEYALPMAGYGNPGAAGTVQRQLHG